PFRTSTPPSVRHTDGPPAPAPPPGTPCPRPPPTAAPRIFADSTPVQRQHATILPGRRATRELSVDYWRPLADPPPRRRSPPPNPRLHRTVAACQAGPTIPSAIRGRRRATPPAARPA